MQLPTCTAQNCASGSPTSASSAAPPVDVSRPGGGGADCQVTNMVQGGKQLLQEQDKHLADVLNPKQKIMASMLIISARFDCL